MSLNCDKLKNKLSPYLNQELDEKSKSQIELHLMTCPSCMKELEEMKAMFNLLKQFKPVVQFPYPSEDFLLQVRRKIRNRNQQASSRKLLPRLIPIFATVTAIFIIVVGLRYYRTIETKKEAEKQFLSVMSSEKISTAYIYDNLATEIQDVVTKQIISDIAATDLQTMESEILSDMETDDLINGLTDNEKEAFINELLNQYQETQQLNPDGTEINQGKKSSMVNMSNSLSQVFDINQKISNG